MKLKAITTICLIALGTLLAGCDRGSQQSNSDQENASQESSASDSHPKLSLHKPKTLSSAVQRLTQLHESLMADGDFPAPIKIDYVEVIHGQGASGHSHFYSAADYDANGSEDHEVGHHEEGEKVERHTTEVDLRTEFTDITGWLPKIAAKSDLNESEWNSVDSISSQLSKIIGSIGSDASDDEFRESWKPKSDEVKAMLDKLQTFGDSSGAAK